MKDVYQFVIENGRVQGENPHYELIVEMEFEISTNPEEWPGLNQADVSEWVERNAP